MADWSELDDDLLVEIAKRIRINEDFVCFGGVCRSWQVAAAKENFKYESAQIPWLMLPRKTCNIDNYYLRSFFNVSTGKTRQVYLPEVNRTRCFSSKGWLLIIAQDLSISLLHPFLRTRIILPHMKKFENFEDLQTRNNQTGFIKKCVLSTDPSSTSDYVLMVIHGGLAKLAYYKPGDKVWTTIQEWQGAYRDVAYCKGWFYAIDVSNRLVACDFRGVDGPLRATVVSNIPQQIIQKSYIVESAGSLLLVARMVKGHFGKYRNKRTRQTYEFKVFKWDLNTNTWLKVKDLGSRAIFLGHNSSFSLEASDSCRSNCIYFTDDDHLFHMCNRDGGGRDMGVYNMKDGNIEEFMEIVLNRINPPMWV